MRQVHAALGLVCAALASSVLAAPVRWWPAVGAALLLGVLVLWLGLVLQQRSRRG